MRLNSHALLYKHVNNLIGRGCVDHPVSERLVAVRVRSDVHRVVQWDSVAGTGPCQVAVAVPIVVAQRHGPHPVVHLLRSAVATRQTESVCSVVECVVLYCEKDNMRVCGCMRRRCGLYSQCSSAWRSLLGTLRGWGRRGTVRRSG